MDPRIPKPGHWKSERKHLWDITDSLRPGGSFLDALKSLADRMFRSDLMREDISLDIAKMGLEVIAGPLTYQLKECGVYEATLDVGSNDMTLQMTVEDEETLVVRQVMETSGDLELGGAEHKIKRAGDSAVTARRVEEWDCVATARVALVWGAYARAFGDQEIVNEVAAESETVQDFRDGIDAAQSNLMSSVRERMTDAFPELEDLEAFHRICPSGAEHLGWIDTETGEHTYNDEALRLLPPIITEVVRKHEAIHVRQVAENGVPGNSVFDHADFEAEAYQDSVTRIVAWLQSTCRPGSIPDGFPWVHVTF